MTQKQRIIKRLQRYGYVDNFWALNHYILRLSERIRELEANGYKFVKNFGKDIGKTKKNHKNYYYYQV